jgi:hypothetical protein
MKHDKAPFSLSGEYDARKPITFQGETIAPGERFDWRKLGCSARKLRQLWDNGFIVPAGSLPQAPAGSPPNDSDPGDEQAGNSELSSEEKAKAEAEAKAKRVEAGKKSAEARKAKKAAEAAANGQPPKDPPSGEPS